MLFSFNELKRLANLPDNIDVQQVADAINKIGFEVEDISVFSDVKKLKFARVIDVQPNPNSKKLFVCKLEFDDKTRIIQTTATNVKVNMIVIAFVPGSSKGTMVFANKKMQGIDSEGMLSSPNEFGIDPLLCRQELILGITDYSKEISDLTLDPITYLGLDDQMLDVSILSNRSDAASYYVMAKELAAYFATATKPLQIIAGNYQSSLKVKNNLAHSLVFMEAKVETITIKEQIFLNKHNIKAINDACDLTNLTLLYSGQPTHAYDQNHKLNNFQADTYTGKVRVFGNKEVDLKNTLVIKANEQVVSVASIIGLEQYATNHKSKKIILELGIFPSNQVRQGTKLVKLNTQASQQGSKKLAIGTTQLALIYLTNRLRHFSQPVNFNPLPQALIDFDQEQLQFYAGFNILENKKYLITLKALTSLGFAFTAKKVTIPSYRHDLTINQDIIEEIFRFYGYENLPVQAPLVNNYQVNWSQKKVLKDQVKAMGYQEIRSYSLVSEEKNLLNPFGFKKDQKLKTFVSKEREVVRNSQVLSLWEIATYHYRRKINDLNLFAIGMINDGHETIGALSTNKSLAHIKQDIVNLLGQVDFKRLIIDELHPGVSAQIIKNEQMIGWFGKIHPRLTSVDAFVWEVKLPLPIKSVFFKKYNSIPLQFEDINLIGTQDMGAEIKKLNQTGVFDIKVIDQYHAPKGKRKITVRILKDK